MGAGQLGFKRVHPAFEAQRCDDLGDLSVVAVVTNAHGHFVVEVDPFHLLQKAMHKVLAALLTVAYNIKARIFLRFDPQQGGICLGLLQVGAGQFPLGPEFLGL